MQYWGHCTTIIPFLLLKPDPSSYLSNESHVHQPSFRALESSAIAGCILCRLLRQRVLLLAQDRENLEKCEHAIVFETSEHLFGRATFYLRCAGRCGWWREADLGCREWFGFEFRVKWEGRGPHGDRREEEEEEEEGEQDSKEYQEEDNEKDEEDVLGEAKREILREFEKLVLRKFELDVLENIFKVAEEDDKTIRQVRRKMKRAIDKRTMERVSERSMDYCEEAVQKLTELVGEFEELVGTKLEPVDTNSTAFKEFMDGVDQFEFLEHDSEEKSILTSLSLGDLKQPSWHADSDSTFNLATKWLTECDQYHQKCQVFRTQLNPATATPVSTANVCAFLPKRLLFLGSSSKPSDIRLVLMEPEHSGQPVFQRPDDLRYTCLSYRWGDPSHNTKTTKDNIHEMQRSIPLSTLPKTILDAVYITRRLGIFFLWIDALCIIQATEMDSGDWSEQSSQMDKIYGNAYCTIAASSAKDVYGGCFSTRPAMSLPLVPCQISLPPDIASRDGRKRHQSVWILPLTVPWRQAIGSSPLQKRGWVVQERMLSCRILHWTYNALFWECLEIKASEYEPDGLHSLHFEAFPDSLSLDRAIRKGASKDLKAEFWFGVIDEFSRKHFTKPDDKLPAISGIAHLMSVCSQDNCVAGNWETNLIKELAWRVDEHITASKSIVAPTWSWASVYGAVRFFEEALMPDDWNVANVDILSSSTKPMTIDPFGAVSEARLTVGGNLAILRPSRTTWEELYGLCMSSQGLLAYLDLVTDREEFLGSNGKEIICLEVFRPGPWAIRMKVYGRRFLILRLTGNGNECKRIGILVATFYHDKDVLVNFGRGVVEII